MRTLLLILFSVCAFFAHSQFSEIFGKSTPATKFGVLVNGQFTDAKRASIAADSLHVKYVRMSIKAVGWSQDPNQHSELFDAYVAENCKVILDIDSANQSSGGETVTRRYPRNMTLWTSFVNDLLDEHTPEMIVVGNEELNDQYYDGPLTEYIIWAQTTATVAHARGIKVVNGGIGLNGAGLKGLVFRWVKANPNYGQSIANAFGASCMTPTQVNNANTVNNNVGFEYEVRQNDTVLTGINPFVDYINVHEYEPVNPNLTAEQKAEQTASTDIFWRFTKEYIESRTGKRIMSNEIGVRNNTQPDLVTNMHNIIFRLGYAYAIHYSGTGPAGAIPLTDLQTGEILPNGEAFAGFVSFHIDNATSKILNNEININNLLVFGKPESERTVVRQLLQNEMARHNQLPGKDEAWLREKRYLRKSFKNGSKPLVAYLVA